jgi:hypothetical protein
MLGWTSPPWDTTKGIAMAGGVETIEGPAAVQGDLWSERARDWAEVMEGWNGWA